MRPGRRDVRYLWYMYVLDVEVDDQRLVVTVESDQLEAGCPMCGVLAVGHGRRVHVVHDAPCFDQVTLVRWRKADLALPRTFVHYGHVL